MPLISEHIFQGKKEKMQKNLHWVRHGMGGSTQNLLKRVFQTLESNRPPPHQEITTLLGTRERSILSHLPLRLTIVISNNF